MSQLTPTSVLLFVGLLASHYCRSLALVISDSFNKGSSKDIPWKSEPTLDEDDPLNFNKASSEDIPWKSDHSLDDDSPLTIQCEGTNLSLSIPREGTVLRNPENGKMALWCPNAKIGTSTMSALIATILLGKSFDQYDDISGGHKFVKSGVRLVTDYAKTGEEQQLCHMEMYFTFIRNPWDRLISAYLDKVATRKLLVPGFYNASFTELLYALTEVDPSQMNAHFEPVSTRCWTGIANYTNVYKIERGFEQSLVEVFSSLGVSKERTLGALKRFGAKNQNSQHHRGLRDRQEMFHNNQDLVNLVARLYEDDIAFGGYAFDKLD